MAEWVGAPFLTKRTMRFWIESRPAGPRVILPLDKGTLRQRALYELRYLSYGWWLQTSRKFVGRQDVKSTSRLNLGIEKTQASEDIVQNYSE